MKLKFGVFILSVILVLVLSGCSGRTISGKAHTLPEQKLELKANGEQVFSITLEPSQIGITYDFAQYENTRFDHDIDAFIFYPKDVSPEKSYPVIHLVHGGTEDIYDDKNMAFFIPFALRAAERGFVAVYPNVRHLSYKDKGRTDLLAGIQFVKESDKFIADKQGCFGSSLGNRPVWSVVTTNPGQCDAYVGVYPAWDPKNRDFFSGDEQMAKVEAKTFFTIGTEDMFLKNVVFYENNLKVANPELDYYQTYHEDSDHGFYFATGKTHKVKGVEFTLPLDPNWEEAQIQTLEFAEYALKGKRAPSWWGK